MPREPDSPDALPALGAALEAVGSGARAGADEVLSHYPELGDRETQSTLEGYLDQVADLLREVEASCADLSDRVRLAGGGRVAAPDDTRAAAGRQGGPPLSAPDDAGSRQAARRGP